MAAMRWLNLFRLGAEVLNATGFDRLIGRRYRGRGCIFVLHSVVDSEAESLCDPLSVTTHYLDSVLRHIRGHGVDFVTLDEAVERLGQKGANPFACFTFDDGYRDNLTRALPLFERYDAPMTIFAATCFIERRMNCWWAGVREAIKRNERITIELGGRQQRLDTSGLSGKVRAYRAITRTVGSGIEPTAELDQFFARYDIDMPRILDNLAMNEAELKTAAAHPLVQIGAHTQNHPDLRPLKADQVREEMLANKAYLEAITGREVRHFAYPYGGAANCGEREFRIAREAGFRTAVTTRLGCLFPEHLRHLTALPRLRVFGQFGSVAVADCSRNGALTAFATRFGNPVVTA